MPVNDALGRSIATNADAPSIETALRNYSLSDVGIIKVASRTQANQVLTAYKQAGGTQPVVVWNESSENLEIHPNTGAAGENWDYLAGRAHGATFNMNTTVLRDARDDVVFPSSVIRASAGWTIASDGHNMVFPATGMYHLDLSGTISGTAGDLGRVYTQFKVNDTTIKGRQGVQNENFVHAALLYPFTKGDKVKVEMYHAAGGQRSFSGELNVVQINNPRW